VGATLDDEFGFYEGPQDEDETPEEDAE
jgi:hypothetical protein